MGIFALFGLAVFCFAVIAVLRAYEKAARQQLNLSRSAVVVTCTVGENFSVTFNTMDQDTADIAIEKARAYIAAHPGEPTTMEYQFPDTPD